MSDEELQELRKDPVKFMEWLRNNPNTHFVIGKRRRQLGFNGPEFRAVCVNEALKQGKKVLVLGLKEQGLLWFESLVKQITEIPFKVEAYYSESELKGVRPPCIFQDEMYEHFVDPMIAQLIEQEQFRKKENIKKIDGYYFITLNTEPYGN